MSEIEKECSNRTKLVEKINILSQNIEAGEKRANDAKSNLGTAEAELKKLRNEFTLTRDKLAELLRENWENET